MPTFSLTDEQILAREHFGNHHSLRIQALAGTGKTSTLSALADAFPARRGIYLAFNDAIAKDASARFPQSVACQTTHAYAVAHLKKCGFDHERLVTPPNRYHLRHFAPLPNYEVPLGPRPFASRLVSRNTFCSMLMGTLSNYARAKDTEINWTHVKTPPHLHLTDDGKKAFFMRYRSQLENIWSEMCDPLGKIPLGHDLYLKKWTIDKPSLEADFIMLDEAQDTNDPVIDLLSAQSSQLVCVGDSHQQIYDWRGAVDALKKIDCQKDAPLTGSFRFGSAIADFANGILGGLRSLLKIRGLCPKGDEVVHGFDGKCDAVLFRGNKNLLASLSALLKQNCQVGIVGGVDEWLSYCRALDMLELGLVPDHAEFYGFTDYSSYQQYVSEFPDMAGVAGQLFKLREDFGSDVLSSLLKKTATIQNPEIVLSTVYKAKGLEWDTVELHEDLSGNRTVITDSFRRLQYVAATRAKRRLVCSKNFFESATF